MREVAFTNVALLNANIKPTINSKFFHDFLPPIIFSKGLGQKYLIDDEYPNYKTHFNYKLPKIL